MTESLTQPGPEHEPDLRPRIYVASLSDYNAGRLHGEWIDASQDPEAIRDGITAMLDRSPTPGAEEFAIHDYQGFGPLRLSEFASIDRVAHIARGIVDHGPVFAHWADQLDDAEALDRFEDCFLGEWESVEQYAEQLLEDQGIDLEAIGPEWLRPYISIDIERFADDLAADYVVCELDDGVALFEREW